MGVPCMRAVDERRDHRATCLLQLQEEDVIGAGAHQQCQEGAQADRPDTDHLVCDVHQAVGAHDAGPLQAQRPEVVVQRDTDLVEPGWRDLPGHRQVLDDLVHTPLGSGQLRQSSVGGARPGLGRRPHHLVAQGGFTDGLVQVSEVDTHEAAGQQRNLGQLRQLVSVGIHAGGDRLGALLLPHLVLPSGDVDTGHQPSQIPLPEPRMCLVEVIQVEDQFTLR